MGVRDDQVPDARQRDLRVAQAAQDPVPAAGVRQQEVVSVPQGEAGVVAVQRAGVAGAQHVQLLSHKGFPRFFSLLYHGSAKMQARDDFYVCARPRPSENAPPP